MNVQQAVDLVNLKTAPVVGSGVNVVPEQRATALEVARHVFRISTAKPHGTPEIWASKWLGSKEFWLVTVPLNRVACPCSPKNPQQVQRCMQAGAETFAPIVVDTNKRQVGQSGVGYIPEVIVLDGKHRHQAARKTGISHLKAWVGINAIDKIFAQRSLKEILAARQRNRIFRAEQGLREGVCKKCGKDIDKCKCPDGITAQKTKLEVAALVNDLHSVPDQSRGKTAPHQPIPGVKGFKTFANAIAASGLTPKNQTLAVASNFGFKVITGDKRYGADIYASNDNGDVAVYMDGGWNLHFPLDNKKVREFTGNDYNELIDQLKKLHAACTSPAKQSPGSGVGPRLKPSKGASNSDMQDELSATSLKAGPIHIDKIVTDYKKALKSGKFDPKKIQAFAPPGGEALVKELKDKPGVDNPFAMAWYLRSQGKGPWAKGGSAYKQRAKGKKK